MSRLRLRAYVVLSPLKKRLNDCGCPNGSCQWQQQVTSLLLVPEPVACVSLTMNYSTRPAVRSWPRIIAVYLQLSPQKLQFLLVVTSPPIPCTAPIVYHHVWSTSKTDGHSWLLHNLWRIFSTFCDTSYSNLKQFSKISLALRSFYLKLDLYVYRNLKDGQLKGIRIVNWTKN